MSFRRFEEIVFALAVPCSAIALCSCTVKEDRQICPCCLTLDFSSLERAWLMDEGYSTIDLAIASDDGFSDFQSWPLDALTDEYALPVPRNGVCVTAMCSEGDAVLGDDGFTIAEGSPCSRNMAFSQRFLPSSDEDRLLVSLHKNYCNLEIRLKTSTGASARPFQIRVDGEVNGSLLDGTPKEGAFSYFSAPSSEGLCTAAVPRQKDSSLRLGIYFLDNGEIRSFPIGEYIIESGYNWNALDLEDVSVIVDFSLSGLEVNISNWKKTLSFDITF